MKKGEEQGERLLLIRRDLRTISQMQAGPCLGPDF